MALFTSCGNETVEQIQRKVDLVASFIQSYRWIIEAYVSDFYTHDHWSKLPDSVKEYFDATDPPDWAWLLAQEKNDILSINRPIPLILLALKTYIGYLALKRTAVNLDSSETEKNILHSLQSVDHRFTSKPDQISQNVNASSFQPSNYKNGQCMDMQHIFRRHVKPKKQHEIQKLGQVINLLSTITNCNSVVDVGAGLGHLSRLLVFKHGFKVTTVEADGGHAPKASDFDRELKKDVSRKRFKVVKPESADNDPANSVNHNSGMASLGGHDIKDCGNNTENLREDSIETTAKSECSEEDLPNHVVCRISNDISTSKFVEIIRQNRIQDPANPEDDAFILTGLHACGDLSPSLLRMFVECLSAIGLASVACCYMKTEHLTADPSDLEKKFLYNYPMSNFLKKNPSHELNYESREMACHFADAYCQRLKDNPTHLKIHSYRAALQFIVTRVNPSFQSGQVRLVSKKGAERSFPLYAAEILKKLNIDISELSQEMIHHCEEMTNHWKRVVAFYTLRLSLAPVVESLILLDRILYLKEEGINSVLVPIFDSKMSPRNFAILAVKS